LICEMCRIPRDQYLTNLSDLARQAISDCERRHGEYFRSDFHDSATVDELAAELHQSVSDIQRRSAQRQMLLRKTDDQLQIMSATVRASHAPLFKAQTKILSLNQSHNPHLRYLGYIETRESVYELASTSSRHLESDRAGWKEVESLARKSTAISDANPRVIVECPIDQTKLRVPRGKSRILVTCSSCKYKFIVNSCDGEEKNPPIHPNPIKRGMIWRLRKLFARFSLSK